MVGIVDRAARDIRRNDFGLRRQRGRERAALVVGDVHHSVRHALVESAVAEPCVRLALEYAVERKLHAFETFVELLRESEVEQVVFKRPAARRAHSVFTRQIPRLDERNGARRTRYGTANDASCF